MSEQISSFLDNPLCLHKRFPKLYWAIYGFWWSNYYQVFDNRFARSSVLASFVGYLIYLNDLVADRFAFNFITNNQASWLGLSPRDKLYLIYFGLMFVALARLLYLWRRPRVIRLGPNETNWIKFGLSELLYSDFVQLHDDISQNGHRTIHGKYYTDDWEAFREDAIWSISGRTDGLDSDAKKKSRQHVNFSLAKSKHEDLLRSILIDRYQEYSAKRKCSLAIALIIALIGYAMFFAPNLDLFLTILLSIFSGA